MDTESNSPLYAKLSRVAKRMGVSPHVLLRSIQASANQVEVLRLGKRGSTFVNRQQFRAWLEQQKAVQGE
jgi:hypothetical protein